MKAVEANAAAAWNEIWKTPEGADWRPKALEAVYGRIAELVPPEVRVVDVGGGVGFLAERLRDEKRCGVSVWEHNAAAIAACRARGVSAREVDLETADMPAVAGAVWSGAEVVVATEVLEHLSDAALDRFFDRAPRGARCFFSVPNDRLGPDEEEQHARKWTALEFKRFLRRHFDHVRVEVLGPPARLPAERFPSDRGQPSFLLGVCGFPKAQTVSMCMPARDEEADVEKTLASFMGFCDELVVGIDPRSKDRTRELAEKYADVVFDLTELLGPPDEEVPEGGFHFAHARNQCMARCTSDWIFMTEAHEPLWKGHEVLLHLDEVPADADVVQVLRTGGRAPNRQQWLFPWLCRNGKGFVYRRSTHNTLDYGGAAHVIVPQIKTLHERVHARDVARQKQRSIQNRAKLTEDWLEHGNEWSLHYLGAEWREHDPEKAVEYLREYLRVGTSGALRYHTRLVLAKELVRLGRTNEARDALHGAEREDWCRNEHWIFLGDLAYEDGNIEEAASLYEYALTKKGPPLTAWWIDVAMFTWLPRQRLAMARSELGELPEALAHAEALLEIYAEMDAPEEFVLEAERNAKTIKEAIDGRHERAAAE